MFFFSDEIMMLQVKPNIRPYLHYCEFAEWVFPCNALDIMLYSKRWVKYDYKPNFPYSGAIVNILKSVEHLFINRANSFYALFPDKLKSTYYIADLYGLREIPIL